MYYKFIVVPLTFLAGLFAFTGVTEFFSIDAELEIYKHVYGFTSAEAEWSHQSVTNYKIWLALCVIVSVSYAALSIWNLYTKRRWLNILVMSATAILYVVVIRKFYLWHLSGYDHIA